MEFREVHTGFDHAPIMLRPRPFARPMDITDAEAAAGARFAVQIFRLWDITDAESCILLGGLGARTYARWKTGTIGPMDADRKMRLSILAGIHKGLKYLFTEKQRGYDWIKKPNTHFDGQRPLDIMLHGRMTDLIDIRNYLDAIRG